MGHPLITTYADLIEHGVLFLGGNATAAANGNIRRAIHDAFREVTESRRWNYYLRMHRIVVPAKYSTGTITYTHSTKALTLSGGTWPSWAASGAVEINNRVHRVASRDSNSQLTLHDDINPGENVSSGTDYVIFQNRFSLPADFNTLDMPYASDRWKLGRFRYVHPNDFLAKERDGEGTGSPYLYTIMEDPDNMSRLAIWTWGEPETSSVEDLDFVYDRRPRQLIIDGYKQEHVQGKVSTAASTTLTGIATAFESAMIGSYVRVSRDARRAPTGIDGIFPFAEERKISAVGSTTSLTVSSAFSLTQTRKAYIISDPVDTDVSMLTAIKRGIEAHLAYLYDKRNKAEQQQLAKIAYDAAVGVDQSRVYKPREQGDSALHGTRPAEAAPPDESGN